MSKRHLEIPHLVKGDVQSVFAGFTQALFNALAPSFPPSKLLRYDGNKVGDLVEIRLGIPPFTQVWRSKITAHETTKDECFFIDEGEKLPFPLTYWQHKHIVRRKSTDQVEIIEDITFGTPSSILTLIMTPIIKGQFSARGPKYKAFFKP